MFMKSLALRFSVDEAEVVEFVFVEPLEFMGVVVMPNVSDRAQAEVQISVVVT